MEGVPVTGAPDSPKVVAYGRDYAIVTCESGCSIRWKGEDSEQPDGEEVGKLRALAKRHAAETGHRVQFEMTRLYRFMRAGTFEDRPEGKT